MNCRIILLALLTIALFSCHPPDEQSQKKPTYSDIRVVGAMKNVMWRGQLDGRIQLDTIQTKKGLYGLGPESYLTGELLLHDGRAYVSRVLTDSTMKVEQNDSLSAPFFVFGRVTEWKELAFTEETGNIKALESLLDANTKESKRPFVFRLKGQVSRAEIHVQNLPKGSQVNSPNDAHQGQVNFELVDEAVEIVGFFSTEHQGIFTHHDTFLHMHLITQDRKMMGHLDHLEFEPGKMKLFLPVQ
jgi:acetolactate decarboxylase